MKRIIGILLLVAGLLGLIVGIGGIFGGGQPVDHLGRVLKQELPSTITTLNVTKEALVQTQGSIQGMVGNTRDTLYQVKATLGEVNVSVGDVQDTIIGTTENIDNIDGLLGEIAQTASQQLPTTIDGSLQDLRPGVFEGLDGLSRVPLAGPALVGAFRDPLTEAFNGIEENVAELTQNLRNLEDDFDLGLADVKADVLIISDDVGSINAEIAVFGGLIDEYLTLLGGVESALVPALEQYANQIDGNVKTLQDLDNDLDRVLGIVKMAIRMLMLWLLVVSLAPLYIGWELVRGKGMVSE